MNADIAIIKMKLLLLFLLIPILHPTHPHHLTGEAVVHLLILVVVPAEGEEQVVVTEIGS